MLYEKIVSLSNIEQAYLCLVETLAQESKLSFAGIDGVSIHTTETVSKDLIFKVQKELIAEKEITPAISVFIPKKNGSLREIYLYTVTDRIKAQAITQVLEPIFENVFSPHLYSYRESHPTYYAARSVARQYHETYGSEYVLVSDVENFTEYIQKEILFQKIKGLPLDEKTLRLLRLFIFNTIIHEGKIFQKPLGIVQGNPLIPLFANLYLTAFDNEISKLTYFYRRVGDDFIVFQKNEKVLQTIAEKIKKELAQVGLKQNEQKIFCDITTKPFKYLGYQFEENHIRLEERYKKKLIAQWKGYFPPSTTSLQSKKKHLRYFLRYRKPPLQEEFKQIIKQHPFVDDDTQIKDLTIHFLKIITKFFYGNYSEKNFKKIKSVTKKLRIPSLHREYIAYHYGKNI